MVSPRFASRRRRRSGSGDGCNPGRRASPSIPGRGAAPVTTAWKPQSQIGVMLRNKPNGVTMPIASTDAGTPEAIAYALMQDVMKAEDRNIHRNENTTRAGRAYLLDLYAECLTAAKG